METPVDKHGKILLQVKYKKFYDSQLHCWIHISKASDSIPNTETVDFLYTKSLY